MFWQLLDAETLVCIYAVFCLWGIYMYLRWYLRHFRGLKLRYLCGFLPSDSPKFCKLHNFLRCLCSIFNFAMLSHVHCILPQKKQCCRSTASERKLEGRDAQKLLHTQALLHREVFTQRSFLHTEGFTQRSLYTEELLHTKAFTQQAFTQRSLYTEELLHREIFTQTRFHTEKLSQTEGGFYTKKSLHRVVFTHRNFYTQTLLHREVFAQRRLYTK